eukprot:s596_g2.t1
MGTHFFSPANVMQLLENVRTSKSSAKTLATGMAMGKLISKKAIMDWLCEQGRFGLKTPDPKIKANGRGVFIHRGRSKEVDPEVVAKLDEEGYVARSSDIDLAYIYGYGFPPAKGGPMFYAENYAGFKKILERVKYYSEQAKERFTKNSNYLPIDYFEPSKLLEACAAKEGTKVFPGQTLIDVVTWCWPTSARRVLLLARKKQTWDPKLVMETLADFKKHLRRTYGSYLRAWLLVPRRCSTAKWCTAPPADWARMLGMADDDSSAGSESEVSSNGEEIEHDEAVEGRRQARMLRKVLTRLEGHLPLIEETLRAWRKAFDAEGDGRINEFQFVRLCRQVKFLGDPYLVFRFLDDDASGELTLEEVHKEQNDLWAAFVDFCAENFAGSLDMIQKLNGAGERRVSAKHFQEGLHRYGWTGGYELLLFDAVDLGGDGFIESGDLKWFAMMVAMGEAEMRPSTASCLG